MYIYKIIILIINQCCQKFVYLYKAFLPLSSTLLMLCTVILESLRKTCKISTNPLEAASCSSVCLHKFSCIHAPAFNRISVAFKLFNATACNKAVVPEKGRKTGKIKTANFSIPSYP